MPILSRLEEYRREFLCKNFNDTIPLVLNKLDRMQFIVVALEKKAHEAEGWKLKAEKEAGTISTDITAKNVKISTGSKLKLDGSTSGTRKQGGKP